MTIAIFDTSAVASTFIATAVIGVTFGVHVVVGDKFTHFFRTGFSPFNGFIFVTGVEAFHAFSGVFDVKDASPIGPPVRIAIATVTALFVLVNVIADYKEFHTFSVPH